mgnify:CR=1 FL=1
MAIHEQNYVRYEGVLRTDRAAWTIARASLRTYWGLTRTKIVLLILWLMPLLFIIGVFGEYALTNSSVGQLTDSVKSAPGAGPVTWFIQLSMISLALLLMSSGCGVISDDLRYKTFQLYFSKPISRLQYGIGKFLGLFALGSLITIVPGFMIGALRVVFAMRTDFGEVIAKQVGIGMLLLTCATALFCIIVMGISALTEHTRYVVLSWLGLLIVPSLLNSIISLASEQNPASDLVSITGNIWLVSQITLMDQSYDFPVVAPFIILLAVCGLGAASLARRISRLEGVA